MRFAASHHPKGDSMVNNWKRRDVIGMGGAAALAAAIGIDGGALAAAPASADKGSEAQGADPEKNKRVLREHREESQHHSLPSVTACSSRWTASPAWTTAPSIADGWIETAENEWRPIIVNSRPQAKAGLL
jgi:hypothetical protein